eukprot:gnl/MRDRNA2_/MRDRNA2_334144_c0_seq1.p1 gnl/MRDRNA2_/MRDRNA2_334144_c0~~gnl/MRDRNA2_/MRDRNA2_334144_c0_seq1.p1  ORF type:complete len:199 (-),score=31.19 gnl/MRDRNA2_/MRDRNA2_334144_c0_seq1:125-721(-)
MTKEAVTAEVTALRGYFPDLQDPIGSFATHWTSNPFTLGAYSIWPPGLTVDDKLELQRPEGIQGKAAVIFAGEATQICDAATVHGAMLSGLRASKLARDHLTGKLRLKTGGCMRCLDKEVNDATNEQSNEADNSDADSNGITSSEATPSASSTASPATGAGTNASTAAPAQQDDFLETSGSLFLRTFLGFSCLLVGKW